VFLLRASRFGRANPLGVALTGYELWGRLTPAQQQAVRSAARRGVMEARKSAARARKRTSGPRPTSGRPEHGGDQKAGKFVLKKGPTGKFHFNLLASNGKVIATSESYESKAAALKGIESVKKHAPDAITDDQT
jgi:uncharacterized protein YegP (UPF0339 family)